MRHKPDRQDGRDLIGFSLIIVAALIIYHL